MEIEAEDLGDRRQAVFLVGSTEAVLRICRISVALALR
jgi:hypothetical protein